MKNKSLIVPLVLCFSCVILFFVAGNRVANYWQTRMFLLERERAAEEHIENYVAGEVALAALTDRLPDIHGIAAATGEEAFIFGADSNLLDKTSDTLPALLSITQSVTKPTWLSERNFSILTYPLATGEYIQVAKCRGYINNLLRDARNSAIIVSLFALMVGFIALYGILYRSLRPLKFIDRAVLDLAKGRRPQKLNAAIKTEMGIIGRIFNRLIEGLASITGTLLKISEKVQLKNKDLSQISASVEEAAVENMTKVNELLSSMETAETVLKEGSAALERALGDAREGDSLVEQALLENSKGAALKREITAGLSDIEAVFTDINRNTMAITQIAEDTGLLALNTAIKAAGAGDEGKGFTVIAQEVRQLTEKTASLVENIQEVATEVQDQRVKVVQEIQKSNDYVQKTQTMISEARENFKAILLQIEETKKGMDRNMEKTAEIKESTVNISAAIEEEIASAGEMRSFAVSLKEMVASFEQTAAFFKELV